LKGRKFTLFGVIAMASAASALYGLYRAGVIKNQHFTRPYDAIKHFVERKLKIVSKSHAVSKARGRRSKKR
jgi:hypothetical protein